MIAVVDYGMGNLDSVAKALNRVGGVFRFVERPEELAHFDRILLPGVGNFGDGMEHLRSRGWETPLRRAVDSGVPMSGICLGMQMMLEASEEAPGVRGLGLFRGRCRRFPDDSAKVPHIGWNDVTVAHFHPAAQSVSDGDFFYFVHSYYAELENPEEMILQCNYIFPFAAAIGRGNIFAVQFHPEKSQDAGLALLKRFVEFA